MKKARFKISFLWIPKSFGGHSGGPWEGMRIGIRWEKHLDEYLKCLRDVQWIEVTFNECDQQGQALCEFGTDEPVAEELLKEGTIVHFLNGYNLLAIGRMV